MPDLEIITDPADFASLAPHWDALLERSSVASSPFMSWDWVRLWWEHSSVHCRLCVGVVRDGSRLLAVAPFVIGNGRGRARKYLRHLSFIGGLGDLVSESMDFIIPVGEESVYAPQLCQLFRRTEHLWDVLDLPFIAQSSVTLPYIQSATAYLGQLDDRFAPVPSHRKTLEVEPEQIEKVMGSKAASQHRAHWRKLQANHNARVIQAPQDVSAEVAFDRMLELHAMRYEHGTSSFLLPGVLAFHRELLSLWLSQGKAILVCMEVDGKIAAARYCLLRQGVCYEFQGGYDTQYSFYSLGRLATLMAMAEAVRRGATVYDHLPGDQEHKRRLQDHSVTFRHLELFHPRHPLPFLFTAVRGLKRIVRPTAAVAL
jgi:CelD/BcsL family acetyltransferase involved in cellulose biosynthesis